jgi:hypothetical protein
VLRSISFRRWRWFWSLPAAARREIHRSRNEIISVIADASDLTLVLGRGNRGDDLIHEGTRQLLGHTQVREIYADEIDSHEGEVALLVGSGGWSTNFHAQMPAALQHAEQRFNRVVVLPSSFDLRDPTVASIVQSSRAIFFARELESYRQLAPFVRVLLAYDAAFYFDYSPYIRSGRGVLHAFRQDADSLVPRPAGNDDISTRCETLQSWLQAIASHAEVFTDRAHVMIAAALLGKSVTYWPTRYHKVAGIAEYSLRHFPVRRGSPSSPAHFHSTPSMKQSR